MRMFQAVSDNGRIRTHVVTGWFVVAMGLIVSYTRFLHSLPQHTLHPVAVFAAVALLVIRLTLGILADVRQAIDHLHQWVSYWVGRQRIRMIRFLEPWINRTQVVPLWFVRLRRYSVFCVYRA